MPQEPWLVAVILLAAAAAVVAAVAALVQGLSLRRRLEAAQERQAREQGDAMRSVGTQLTEVAGRLHAQLGEVGRQMNESLNRQMAVSQKTLGEGISNATRVFGSVREQLGQVAEMAQRMERLGRSIEELEGILKVPKLRGLFGERALEELLRQVLPAGVWEVQHRFSDGRTVDAVIRVGDRLVPVDAKFPLEAYRRMVAAEDDLTRRNARREFANAVKGRIDEIAERYIRPGEKTFEFALMFVPAEAVYAELVAGESEGIDLSDYALSRRVLPVSPSTFYAYLSTVATGLRGLEVEANAAAILRGIGAVEQQLERFGEEFTVLGKHLGNAATKYSDAERRLNELQARLDALQGVGDNWENDEP
jgi:DNA recombination protein RmuC